ncbi:hypothetical protein CBL_02668 [Carabus blaptoides fortunei]
MAGCTVNHYQMTSTNRLTVDSYNYLGDHSKSGGDVTWCPFKKRNLVAASISRLYELNVIVDKQESLSVKKQRHRSPLIIIVNVHAYITTITFCPPLQAGMSGEGNDDSVGKPMVTVLHNVYEYF